MLLDINPKPNGKNIGSFIIQHNGFELPPIKGGTYGTGGYVDLKTLFTPVNELLAFLGPVVQDALFDEYEKIFQLLSEYNDIKDGTLDAVADCVRVIFEHIEPDQVAYFIKNQKNSIYIPDDLADKVEEHHTAAKTYVSTDYVPLIAFGLCTQILLPVWAHVCTVVKDAAGTRHKEMYCMQILETSNLVESEGYLRLVRFIHGQTSSVKIPLGVLVNEGLSEHTLSKWALANAVVRKLVTTEFCDRNTKVINNIYSSLDGKLKNMQGAFGAYSTDKHAFTRDTSNSQDESGNDSLLEDFKRTSKIPLGYRSALQHYCSDPYRLMLNLIKSSPDSGELMERIDTMVREATELREYLRRTGGHEVNEYTLSVLAMLFKTQFHPVALHYVDYDVNYNTLLAVAFIYIKEIGLKEVHLYLSALEEVTSNRPNIRYSLAKETIERLTAAYPYEYTNAKLSQEQANPGRRNVNASTVFISQRFWVVNLNKRQLNHLHIVNDDEPLIPTTNFKEEYAQLVLHTCQFKYDVVEMDDILAKKY